MTLQELKNEIAALGFESEIEDAVALTFAIKRAIATIYTERGIHKTLRIYQRNPKPDLHIPALLHEGGTQNAFTLFGGAYFFRVSGKGYFSVTDSNGTHEEEFNSNSATARGVISGEGKLTFYGDLSYTVYDLCHFSELNSDMIDEINFGGFAEYEISRIAPDYIGPSDPARDSDGKIISGATICSGTLSVPYSYSGEIVLKYRSRPIFDKDIPPDADLGIDPECEHLLPLLAASYVWLDDDAQKAQYYLSLYREGMAALKLYSARCINAKYENVTGWA